MATASGTAWDASDITIAKTRIEALNPTATDSLVFWKDGDKVYLFKVDTT